MRSPLGQLLLSQRLVTPEQLKAALRAQAALGTRVGSSLVQLGALDLDTLARALSLQYGVPAAYEQDFRSIQPHVLERLPRRLVEKYLAIPLALQHGQATRTLSVALADPDAVAVVDELAFAAGMRVSVNVAPELRLQRYLDEHFRTIEGGVTALPLEVEPEVEIDLQLHHEPGGPTAGQGPTGVWLGEDEERVPGPPVAAPTGTWRELLEQERDPGELLFVRSKDLAPALEVPLSAAETVGLLARTPRREEVGELVLRFMRLRFECGLVMVVKDGMAHGWRGYPVHAGSGPMTELTLPLHVTSCLRAAFDRRLPLHGPPPRDGGAVHTLLWRALRATPPREVSVTPLLVSARVVGLVYGHPPAGAGISDALADELGRVCAAAAQALVRLRGS